MKKHLFLAGLILSLAVLPAAALNFGPLFEAGVDTSVVKPYIYESAAFRLKADNGLGFDAGIRVMENVTKTSQEPFLYYAPVIDFRYKFFYLGGGVLFNSQSFSGDESANILTVLARIGAQGDLWDWKIGKGGFDAGLEISPTLYYQDAESDASKAQISSGFSAFFGTLFNAAKLNVGITLYIPV